MSHERDARRFLRLPHTVFETEQKLLDEAIALDALERRIMLGSGADQQGDVCASDYNQQH